MWQVQRVFMELFKAYCPWRVTVPSTELEHSVLLNNAINIFTKAESKKNMKSVLARKDNQILYAREGHERPILA